MIVGLRERAEGALLGAAAGDALGWPVELRGGLLGGQSARDALTPQPRYIKWRRRSGSRYTGFYEEDVNPGEYSDDTQLICSVARACLAGEGWLERLRSVELPAWRGYQRGGGRAVLAASSSWDKGKAPWHSRESTRAKYFQAGGNGAAMRVAPHVLYTTGSATADALELRVLHDSLTTHGHPRAILGALMYAKALKAALEATETIPYGALLQAARQGIIGAGDAAAALPSDWGRDSDRRIFHQVWRQTETEAIELLNKAEDSLHTGALSRAEPTLTSLGAYDPKTGAAGTTTAVAALYLASRAAARPLAGLLDAAFLKKADTDTIASMTGGVLGAIHGSRWLGDLALVQDGAYLRRLAGMLIEGSIITVPRPEQTPATLSDALTSRLLGAEANSSKVGIFPDGREYSLAHRKLISQRPRVGRAFLRLDDGQTVIWDTVLPVDSLERHLTSNEGDQPIAREQLQSKPSMPDFRTTITLPTRDVHALAHFYSELLDRQFPVEGETLAVGEGLQFLQAYGADEDADTKDETVFIALKGKPERSTAGSYASTLRAIDPDGRTVHVAFEK